MAFLIWLRLKGGFSNGTRFRGSASDFLLAGGTKVRPPAPIFTQPAKDNNITAIVTTLSMNININMNKTNVLNQGLPTIPT